MAKSTVLISCKTEMRFCSTRIFVLYDVAKKYNTSIGRTINAKMYMKHFMNMCLKFKTIIVFLIRDTSKSVLLDNYRRRNVKKLTEINKCGSLRHSSVCMVSVKDINPTKV